MTESDIRHHEQNHKTPSHDEHPKEDHIKPSSESIIEAEKHEQHKKGHQQKERDKTMRNKIAASIMGLAVLTMICFISTNKVKAASIQTEQIINIQEKVVNADQLVPVIVYTVNRDKSAVTTKAAIKANKIGRIDKEIAITGIDKGILKDGYIDVIDNGVVVRDRIGLVSKKAGKLAYISKKSDLILT